ncbi:tyrosine-type recombinase/integrase [Cohnella panacarvi]|uniref:tyrosine-type recombinase/integrase n=1 Tax=Cohnella panacarvi TaxID=400776 RepID=UPI00047DB7DC|nr:tyrosine-type recombinase/integrase [Cohnella panacarvi]
MSIDINISKIEQVFYRAKQNGLTFGDHAKKKRLSDRTVQTYCDVVKAYANYLHREHGIDIIKAKPKHAYDYIKERIEKFHKGQASAFSLRRFAHAIHAFREASQKTGVFKGKVKIGDKREILQMLTDNNVFRKSADSKTLKANHADYLEVQREIINSRSPNASTTAQIHQIQRYLGARIHEAVKMKVNDLVFGKGIVTVTIKGKGGLVRHVTTDHGPTIELLQSQARGKKNGTPLFSIINKLGQDKSLRSSVKAMKDNIRSAAKRAGVDREGKTYTSHSARKAFAQAEMDRYSVWNVSQLKSEVGKRIAADPSLKTKYDKTLHNIRAKISDCSPNKSRDLSHKELCQWLVSTALGHGRNDVIRYYCNYPMKRK